MRKEWKRRGLRGGGVGGWGGGVQAAVTLRRRMLSDSPCLFRDRKVQSLKCGLCFLVGFLFTLCTHTVEIYLCVAGWVEGRCECICTLRLSQTHTITQGCCILEMIAKWVGAIMAFN